MDQQLSEEDLEVLTSRLSRQVEENEELKAQMLVSVMSAPETQDMLDDLYGKHVCTGGYDGNSDTRQTGGEAEGIRQ